MCGLFGFVRPRPADPGRAVEIFSQLGYCAMERGRDASGWATLRSPGAEWHVERAPRPFGALWPSRSHVARLRLARASVVMAHTRAASQGSVGLIANCSPMPVGPIVGTHNGDIWAEDLAQVFGIERASLAGETDTEVLLRALGLGSAREVLEAAIGRVALVWADKRRPGRLFLARGAWSPLYVTTDEEGVLWWASSPAWLEKAVRGANPVYRLREGTVAEVDIASARLVRTWQFMPKARASDAWAERYAYAGVPACEKAEDMARHVHQVVAGAPLRSWWLSDVGKQPRGVGAPARSKWQHKGRPVVAAPARAAAAVAP